MERELKYFPADTGIRHGGGLSGTEIAKADSDRIKNETAEEFATQTYAENVGLDVGVDPNNVVEMSRPVENEATAPRTLEKDTDAHKSLRERARAREVAIARAKAEDKKAVDKLRAEIGIPGVDNNGNNGNMEVVSPSGFPDIKVA